MTAETITEHRIAVTLQHAEQTTILGVPRTITVEAIVPTGANWLAAEEAARDVLVAAGFTRPLEWTRRQRPVYLGPVHPGDDTTPALRHLTDPPEGGWPSDADDDAAQVVTRVERVPGETPLYYLDRQEPNGSWLTLAVYGNAADAALAAETATAATPAESITPEDHDRRWAARP